MNDFKEKNKKFNGIEVIEGGIRALGKIKGGGCVCSPGGHAFGRDDCGCACGCFGPSPAADNSSANLKSAS